MKKTQSRIFKQNLGFQGWMSSRVSKRPGLGWGLFFGRKALVISELLLRYLPFLHWKPRFKWCRNVGSLWTVSWSSDEDKNSISAGMQGFRDYGGFPFLFQTTHSFLYLLLLVSIHPPSQARRHITGELELLWRSSSWGLWLTHLCTGNPQHLHLWDWANVNFHRQVKFPIS